MEQPTWFCPMKLTGLVSPLRWPNDKTWICLIPFFMVWGWQEWQSFKSWCTIEQVCESLTSCLWKIQVCESLTSRLWKILFHRREVRLSHHRHTSLCGSLFWPHPDTSTSCNMLPRFVCNMNMTDSQFLHNAPFAKFFSFSHNHCYYVSKPGSI